MDDDIQLPPLPPFSMAPVADTVTVRDYARAAVLADRERRAKVAAKPVVHEATVWLHRGGVWLNDVYRPADGRRLDLCWTGDGRAWIDSEKNRDMARRLRVVAEVGYTAPTDAALRDAADALDGGER